MSGSNTDRKRVQTVQTSFDILECLREKQGASTATVAAELNLAESTAHRHLSTLLDREYLIKEGNQYDIGSRFLEFGEYASQRTENYVVAQNVIDEVAKETKEQVHFFVEEHGWGIQIYTEGGGHAVNSGPGRGHRLPLHSTASGKAILAHLSEQCRNIWFEEKGLSELTDNTITDREELEEQLEIIRERGYAKTSEEHVQGIHAIGVPVMNSKGGVLGAISVSGPQRLSDKEREIGEYLVGRANELELNIGFSSGTKRTRTVESI